MAGTVAQPEPYICEARPAALAGAPCLHHVTEPLRGPGGLACCSKCGATKYASELRRKLWQEAPKCRACKGYGSFDKHGNPSDAVEDGGHTRCTARGCDRGRRIR